MSTNVPPSNLERIYFEALAIEQSEARSAYLKERCGDDAALRIRVERLLSARMERGNFLDSQALPGTAQFDNLVIEGPGATIGPHRLLEEIVGELLRKSTEGRLVGAKIGSFAVQELIGEGGMGYVYLARRIHGDRQTVALKAIKPGMDSQQLIARFELERAALAKMDHPHIAQFIEAGVTEQGRAYFAMELVRGLPITAYCDRQRLNVTQRLKLMIDVCLAVQHAHSKGLVHRDIKPSNVLVTEADGEPIVKVIDFGIAKALDLELCDRTIFTQASQVIGTPLYMSPEQARWCPNVDIRSDVYSLGVLLYELLAGAPPFGQEKLNQVGFEEFRRIVQEDDPRTPSQRIASLRQGDQIALASDRKVSPKQLSLQVRGDLDWIALMALAKDPAQRYANPGELAEDLDRYLTHRTVCARSPSLRTRARKWARRHPRIYWGVYLTLIAAVVLGGAWRIGREVEDARSAAVAAHEAAQQQADHLEYCSDVQSAWVAVKVGDKRRAAALLDKHKPRPGKPDDVGFEWHYLSSLIPHPLQVWQGHQAGVLTADDSPNGKWFASGDRGGAVLIWDSATGQQIHSLSRAHQEVTTVKFSPNGKWLATSGVDDVIHIWETGTWTEVRQLRKHEHTVCGVAWSPDSDCLAAGDREGNVFLWEVSTGRHLQTLRNDVDVVRYVAWSPDGRYLASGNGQAGGVNLWDTTTWQLKATYQGKGMVAQAVAFSSDGPWMAFGGYGGVLTVVNVDESMPEVSRDTAEQIWSLRFLPGDRIAAGLGKGLVEVVQWNPDRRSLESQRVTCIGGNGTHRAILPVLGGRGVVLASEEDHALQLFSAAALWGCHVESLSGTPLGTVAGDLLYIDDNSRFAVKEGLFGPKKTLADGWGWRTSLSAHSAANGLVAVCNYGEQRRIAKICLYDSADWRRHEVFQAPSIPEQMSFSRDGRFLVGGGIEGKVWLYDLATEALRGLSEHNFEWAAAVAFSPTQDVLVLGACGEKKLTLLSVPAFEVITTTQTHSTIKSLAFAPDGMRLAVGQDDSISIREVNNLRLIEVLRGHPGDVNSVTFSADGRTLASAGVDGIRLWDVVTGREFYTIPNLRSGPAPRWLEFVSPTTLLAGHEMRCDFYQYGESLDGRNR